MALSYEFSIGSVRAKENSMLTDADVEQMLALSGENELVRFLKDKGYGDGSTIDEVIESNAGKMWKYIKSIAPDFDLFTPFLLQNDVHNLKTVLKGVMSDRKYKELLAEPCIVKPEDMIKAVENRRFNVLPEWLRSPADKAYELLAETKDSRLSDAYIDKAVLTQLLEYGKSSRSVFMKEYFDTLVFYANVKTALRGTLTGAGKYFFENALCDCEGFDRAQVIKTALQGGHEGLEKYFGKLTAYDCSRAMDEYKKSAPGFEKFVDNKLIRLARQICRLSSEGAEPLLGYYIGCEYERKLISIVSSGLKTNTPPDKIRERLREIYG